MAGVTKTDCIVTIDGVRYPARTWKSDSRVDHAVYFTVDGNPELPSGGKVDIISAVRYYLDLKEFNFVRITGTTFALYFRVDWDPVRVVQYI